MRILAPVYLADSRLRFVGTVPVLHDTVRHQPVIRFQIYTAIHDQQLYCDMLQLVISIYAKYTGP